MSKIKFIKGFTLIELLVVVAIIGILAAVGTVAYNGYTSAAKRHVAISNFKQVSKYITNEVAKCTTGLETSVMNGNLDCSLQGRYEWMDDVINATVAALGTTIKNPWDQNASDSITGGGQYWYNKDVGFVRIHSEDPKFLHVIVCVQTPCGSPPHENIYESFPVIDE